jgi:hypothetical protein
MSEYTQAEKLVLPSGLSSGRNSLWSNTPGTLQRLGERGLVKMVRRETGEEVPVGLTDAGVIEARRVQDSSYG